MYIHIDKTSDCFKHPMFSTTPSRLSITLATPRRFGGFLIQPGSLSPATSFWGRTPCSHVSFPDPPWCWKIHLQNWMMYGVNVGKYPIHGAYGIHIRLVGRSDCR